MASSFCCFFLFSQWLDSAAMSRRSRQVTERHHHRLPVESAAEQLLVFHSGDDQLV
jgi:hypothetical protein